MSTIYLSSERKYRYNKHKSLCKRLRTGRCPLDLIQGVTNSCLLASRRITSQPRIQFPTKVVDHSRNVEYINLDSCVYRRIVTSLFYTDCMNIFRNIYIFCEITCIPYSPPPGRPYSPSLGRHYNPFPSKPCTPSPGSPYTPPRGRPYTPSPGRPYTPSPGRPYTLPLADITGLLLPAPT